jgi:Tfp pilus assembly protein PilF
MNLTPVNNGSSSSALLRSVWVQRLVVLLAVVLVYFNSLHNKFNLDDELYHKRATELAEHGAKGLLRSFTTVTFVEENNAYEYRPLTLAGFVLQYELLGEAPAISHFINLLLYLATCLLLFRLLSAWFSGKTQASAAFWITLLFALHPLHTEIVDSIKNRDELLAFFFALLSYLAAWHIPRAGAKKLLYIVMAVVCFFLAIISKKTIWPFFIIVPLAFYFFSNLPVKRIVAYTLLFVLSIFLYRVYNVLHLSVNRPFYEHENPFYLSSFNIFTRSATAFYIMGRYLILHIFPYQLAYYYGADYVRVVSWSDPLAIASLLFYTLLSVFAIRHFLRRDTVAFGAIIYLAAMLMYSNLFMPAPGLMAERYTYISTLGFSIMLYYALQWLLLKIKASHAETRPDRYLHFSILLVLLFYAVRCIARNNDWYDKDTLYAHDMAYLGSSAKANSLYAEQLVAKAKEYRIVAQQSGTPMYTDSVSYYLSAAKDHFKRTLSISPTFPNVLNDLALIYTWQDSLGLARDYMRRSLATTTKPARTYHDIAMLDMKEGSYDSAMIYFQRSIRTDSTFMDAYCDLSKLLVVKGDTVGAENALLTVARRSNSSVPYIQLADVSSFKHDTTSIVYYCRIAAELKPANKLILSFLIDHYNSHRSPDSASYYRQKLEHISK